MRPRAWHAACACGSVRFWVRCDPADTVRCICARCRGAGLSLAHVPRADFRLLSGSDDLTEPLAGARTPHHFFCGRCGEACFGHPAAAAGGDGPVSVNVALLSRGDPADLDPAMGPGIGGAAR